MRTGAAILVRIRRSVLARHNQIVNELAPDQSDFASRGPAMGRGSLHCMSPLMGVGWDRGADRASNDADVSSALPIIPYGGFSPVRLQGWLSKRCLPGSS